MKIAMTTVGTKGPGEEGQNEERLEAAERALRTSNKLGADLIVLPAGYFTAPNALSRNAIARSLLSMAKEVGIAIIFGVDQEIKSLSRDYGLEIQKGGLPFYGYAWSPSENMLHCWSQRSTNSRNQWWAPEGVCKEVRLLSVRNETVALLMCGEIFNHRIRDALVNYRPSPKIIVDVAHIGAGFRVAQSMKVLARRGLSSLCSVHVQREYATKYYYSPPEKRLSSSLRDAYIYGPPRIELKLWTL